MYSSHPSVTPGPRWLGVGSLEDQGANQGQKEWAGIWDKPSLETGRAVQEQGLRTSRVRKPGLQEEGADRKPGEKTSESESKLGCEAKKPSRVEQRAQRSLWLSCTLLVRHLLFLISYFLALHQFLKASSKTKRHSSHNNISDKVFPILLL